MDYIKDVIKLYHKFSVPIGETNGDITETAELKISIVLSTFSPSRSQIK